MAGVPVAQLMRSPSLISDDRLRREVEECLAQDKDYSPHMDRVRRGLGAEYEFILQQKLRARCVRAATGVLRRSRCGRQTSHVHESDDAVNLFFGSGVGWPTKSRRLDISVLL